MQIQQASKAGQKVSIIDTFKAEYKLGGFNRVAGFATNVRLDDHYLGAPACGVGVVYVCSPPKCESDRE
jgi:hypothetical protein